MKRTQCIYCLQKPLIDFLNLGETPLADEFPSTVDQVQMYYPLGLAVCERCNLVQLNYVVSDEELYGRDYGFYTGASGAHKGYWAQYAATLTVMFPQATSVLEVACNDGTLMSYLNGWANYVVRGVDPAKGPVENARAIGLEVDHDSFGLRYAQEFREDHGPVDLLIANNVLAHVSSIEDFVRGVVHVLGRDGVAVIEVQYLADLLTGNMFDHVYHEHRSYFSLTTLQRCTLGLGLRIFDVELTNAQGGSIRVYLDKGSNQHLVCPVVEKTLRREQWMSDWGTYDGFQGRVDHIAAKLYDLVEYHGEFRWDGALAGYGAPAKSTTLLNYCDFGPNHLDFIEDTTPTKWGRFTPGTGIPIVEPGSKGPVDTYLMLVWNYAPSVLAREIQANPDTRFIIPIPFPVVY